MLGFKTIIFALFAMTVAHAQDLNRDYLTGLAYLNGDMGMSEKTIQMPNCPYENCDEAIDKDGMRLVNIPVKDYKSAVIYLRKAVDGGSAEAAEALFGYLKGLINYKDRKPNGFLKDKMKEEAGITYDEWLVLCNQTLNILEKNNNCGGVYFNAERYQKGWMGALPDEEKSKELYEKTLHVCPVDTYEYMMASMKKNK